MNTLSKQKTWLFAGVMAAALLSAPVISPSYAADDAKAKAQTEQKAEDAQPTFFEKVKAFFAGEPKAEDDKDAKASEKVEPQKESSLGNAEPKIAENAAPPPASELETVSAKESDKVSRTTFGPAMSRILDDAERMDTKGI